MAAITFKFGVQSQVTPLESRLANEDGAVAGLSDAETAHLEEQVIAQTHASLWNMAYLRDACAKILKGRKITVEYDKGEVWLVLDKPLPQEPSWNPPTKEGLYRFRLLSWTSKMGTPSFSLPAGAPSLGGSCPGAVGGQTLVPLGIREKQKRDVEEITKIRVDPAKAICQHCVTGDTQITVGNFGNFPTIAEMVGKGEFEVWSGLAWRTTHAIAQGRRSVVRVRYREFGGRELFLRCTPDHKILTEGRGMVTAGSLTSDDILFGSSCTKGCLVPGHLVIDVTNDGEDDVFDLVNVGAERHFLASGVVVSNCYAEGGQYSTGQVQYAQLMRFAWADHAVRDGTFAQIMSWAVKHADYALTGSGKVKMKDDNGEDISVPARGERDGRKYFRIHDSGDFFSTTYLAAWRQVADANPDVTFWAPSRIWALGRKVIQSVNEINAPVRNLIIRPSAYSINERDLTTSPRGTRFVDNPLKNLGPGWAAGTTVYGDKVTPKDMSGDVIEPNIAFDWDCKALPDRQRQGHLPRCGRARRAARLPRMLEARCDRHARRERRARARRQLHPALRSRCGSTPSHPR